MKQCTSCEQLKPLTEYYADKNKVDGLYSRCKKCHLVSTKKWQTKNIENRLIYSAQWRAENKDRQYLNVRKWQLANPEKRAAYENARRAKRASNQSYLITDKFLLHLYNSNCVFCGKSETITADHIIPVSRGGSDSEGNLQPLCKSCNSSKKDKTIMEWRISQIRKGA